MRRPRTVLVVGLVLAGVVAVGAVGVALRHVAARSVTVTARDIPGSGGVALSSYVVTPPGRDRFPLLVMPTAWGEPRDYYLAVATGLAKQGYGVVTYAQRGFFGSGGEIDFAAPPTQADVSAVLDWALAHLHARADQIGAVGISYGGGASLLAAARDRRIRAVVAMSSWADLAAAFFPNATPSERALRELFRIGGRTGRMGVQLTEFGGEYASGDVTGATATFRRLSASRSAAARLDALNANHPAVMLANAYQDSVVPPGQVVSFFTRLTGPKRLQLAVGDHAGPESAGLSGARNRVWRDAAAWLDRYVRGRANGVDRQPAVRLEDAATRAWHDYPDWQAVGKAVPQYLGPPATGTVGARPQAAWAVTLAGGLDSVADSAAPQLDAKKRYRVTSGVRMAGVDRSRAAMWSGAALPAATLVQGRPSLRVTVTASGPDASVFAYLYDVDAAGSGTLLCSAPYTLSGVPPGTPHPVDVQLEPISWTVPAGHHLALVIDTADPRYRSLSAPGSTVTLSSSAAAAAVLAVPVGQ